MRYPRNFEEFVRRTREYFKDFTFDTVRYGSSEGPLSSKWQDIDVFTWGKGGSGCYSFVLQGSRLTVHWNDGAAVFQFTEQPTWSQLMKEYELDYFMKKCVASPSGTPWVGWSISDAIKSIQEVFAEAEKEANDAKGIEQHEHLVDLFAELGGWDALEEDTYTWDCWLVAHHEDVDEIFGYDWADSSRITRPGIVWSADAIRVWVAMRMMLEQYFSGLDKALEEEHD